MESETGSVPFVPDSYGGRNINEGPDWGTKGRAAFWKPFSQQLTAGQQVTFRVQNFEPEYWSIAVVAVTTAAQNIMVASYSGGSVSGIGLPLVNKGRVKHFPANANDPAVTFINNGTDTCIVVAIAIYGIPDFDYSPGE